MKRIFYETNTDETDNKTTTDCTDDTDLVGNEHG